MSNFLWSVVMFTVFIALVTLGLNILPTTAAYPLPAAFGTSLHTVLAYYYAWSSVFTVLSTLVICAGLGITVELSIFVWRIIKWLLRFFNVVV